MNLSTLDTTHLNKEITKLPTYLGMCVSDSDQVDVDANTYHIEENDDDDADYEPEFEDESDTDSVYSETEESEQYRDDDFTAADKFAIYHSVFSARSALPPGVSSETTKLDEAGLLSLFDQLPGSSTERVSRRPRSTQNRM